MTSLFHPLCGSNLKTLLHLFTSNGGVDFKYLPHASFALALTLARLPFSTLERLYTDLMVSQTSIDSPIFIVGYWRSGTTHLHNLLSQDQQFGYISPLAAGLPWDILGIVRTLEPLLELALPNDRYVDQVAVTPDSPQEDSIALASMMSVSYYHGLYFPKRFAYHFNRGVFFDGCSSEEVEQWRRWHKHLLQKVSIHQNGKQLLMKNPVYSSHIPKLREIWPNAKFIHIYRNPYTVFPSTRHFFTRLLPELALQSPDLVAVEQIDRLILDSYPRMLNTLISDSAELPANSFVEVRFEDLETEPLRELEKIYQQLELSGFEMARSSFEHYLAGLQGYQKNQYTFAPDLIEQVETHWMPLIQHWGYSGILGGCRPSRQADQHSSSRI